MKILCLSDLHRNYKCDLKHSTKIIREVYKECKPDIVIISGDIHDIMKDDIVFINPYKDLANLFNNTLTLCCLGNHEFAHTNIERVHNLYKSLYEPDKYNVHYLDIIGSYKYHNLNFVGNVFWYDGSMKSYADQNVCDISKKWLDSTIIDFNPIEENKKCIKQILDNKSDLHLNFLITHTVPHISLNIHQTNPSILNAYSGVANFLDYYKFDYSISGHTHRRIIGKIINGCTCINVGNDYILDNDIKYYLMEG